MTHKTLFLPLLIGAWLLTACGDTSNTDESSTEVAGEKPAANANGCPSTPAVRVADRLDTLNIIIETSGSMKGFMPTQSRQTGFQEQVDDLLANAESDQQGIKKLRLFTAQDNIRTIGYDRFQSMLRQGLSQAGASSPIPTILKQIATQYTGPGQVSVFISDFIYSPPNARDRDYISNDVRRALAPLQEKGLAVAVFGFSSEFQGTFYPAGAKNGGNGTPVTNCCETDIPYYIWIMGPEASVRLASNRLLRGNKPEVAMQSGYARVKPAYGIVPGSGRSGSWYLGSEGDQTILVDNTQELRQGELSFTVGINLEPLATQYAAPEYLSEHLKLQVRNGTAAVEEVLTRQQFIDNEKLNAKDRQLMDCFTHLVRINIKGVDDRNSPLSVQLQLPAQNPQWADSWTTDDDRTINEAGARTFALNEILLGLRQLYPQEREAVFNLDLSIKKAN